MFLQKRDVAKVDGLKDDFQDHIALFSTSVIFLIISGILLVVRGYKIYRLAIMLASAMFFASISVSLTLTIDSNVSDTTLLIIGLVTGIIGAFIGYKFYRFCLVLLGALAGAYLGFVILQLKQPILIESPIWRFVLIAVLAIIGSILVIKVEKIAVICATSIIGSYFLMLSIDLFANWGFKNSILLWKSGDYSITSNNAYILIAGFVVVAAFGILIQRRSLK
eukprot:NODE_59_length_25653_cov_0.289622.p12 type:complete len:222 gc:universal NODE_59_length_25653_cov_0.289622:16815-17480(+)